MRDRDMHQSEFHFVKLKRLSNKRRNRNQKLENHKTLEYYENGLCVMSDVFRYVYKKNRYLMKS